MKRLLTCTVVLLAFAVQTPADQFTLKNGDRATGKIVKSDGGKLVVTTDLLGDASVDRPRAKENQLFLERDVNRLVRGDVCDRRQIHMALTQKSEIRRLSHQLPRVARDRHLTAHRLAVDVERSLPFGSATRTSAKRSAVDDWTEIKLGKLK